MCMYFVSFRWMGAESNETLRTTLENFANENYAYVREKLSDWVRNIKKVHIVLFNEYFFLVDPHFGG